AGQRVCRRRTQQPCYKIVYFHDASRRTSYGEAHLACRADGGHLLSIETAAEQRLIEKFIQSLLASDGDFWIGLRRKQEEVDNSTECQSLYSWSDGSSSTFQNWYVDEPSCGSEVCVVMYHQPSAPPGVGGPYMFQWNDDRCNMKNNFICKYSLGKTGSHGILTAKLENTLSCDAAAFGNWKRTKTGISFLPLEPVLHLAYILLPSIAVLLASTAAIVCFWAFTKRYVAVFDASPKEESAWLADPGRSSPNLDVYRVIKKQSEADLAGTRPDTTNSSFRAQEDKVLDSLSRDGDDLAMNTSTSGFVTLASSESGFVTNDIYELCGERLGRSKESAWVENEIYGY
ncbi:LAYN protein, partial [Alcedo cyanopectus]|nr:LAYN protein [Ceyx cyanopectus]